MPGGWMGRVMGPQQVHYRGWMGAQLKKHVHSASANQIKKDVYSAGVSTPQMKDKKEDVHSVRVITPTRGITPHLDSTRGHLHPWKEPPCPFHPANSSPKKRNKKRSGLTPYASIKIVGVHSHWLKQKISKRTVFRELEYRSFRNTNTGLAEISLWLKEYDSYHRLLHWSPMGFEMPRLKFEIVQNALQNEL